MELSSRTLADLSVAGDSAYIADSIFKSLVEKSFEGVVDVDRRDSITDDPIFKDVDKAVVKEAYGGLVSMVIEAAKTDADVTTLSTLLEECKFPADRVDVITKIHQVRKPFMQLLLGKIGNSLPHVVDVDWRLDYYIKNNHLERVNEAVYMINLKCQVAGKLELEDLQFTCTMEQLQDFVGKLKDGVKSMERFAQ